MSNTDIVIVNGIRYRREDAQRRGLIEPPEEVDVTAEVEAKLAERIAEFEQGFDARVAAEVEKRIGGTGEKAASGDPAGDAKTPKNKAATPASK